MRVRVDESWCELVRADESWCDERAVVMGWWGDEVIWWLDDLWFMIGDFILDGICIWFDYMIKLDMIKLF